MRPLLILMAKEPVAGRVKTRLAKAIGTSAATGVYRAMQSTAIARLAHDPRWQTVVCVTPDSAVASPAFPARLPRIAQGGGDLGQRMQRVFDTVGRGPAAIVGTDIPSIAANDIAHAFRLLRANDAVLGPAADGGYWLIGLRRRPRVLQPFANVRWSGPDALADTLANLAPSAVALLRALDDLDTNADLKRLRPHIGRRIPPRC